MTTASATSLPIFIGQMVDLELSQTPENARWGRFHSGLDEMATSVDEIHRLTHTSALWQQLFRQCPPEVHDLLSNFQMQLMAVSARQQGHMRGLGAAAKECIHKQKELRKNVQEINFRAVEGFLAYRPPPFADVAAMSTCRVDIFNQGLGEVQPPDGPPDVNDGHGDLGVEDAQGVVRTRPLKQTHLLVDPTNIVQMGNL